MSENNYMFTGEPGDGIKNVEGEENMRPVFRIKLGRHGEKDQHGNLTDVGVKQAQAYGDALQINGVVHEVTSDIKRAKETGDIIRRKLEAKGLQAGSELWGDILSYTHVPVDPRRVTAKTTYEDVFARVLESQKSLLGHEPNPEELKAMVRTAADAGMREDFKDPVYAENAASRVAYLLNMLIEWLEQASPEDVEEIKNAMVNFISVTHAGFSEGLLKYALMYQKDGQPVKGVQDINEIGGPFQPTEFMEISVVKDEMNSVHVKILFDNPQRLPMIDCELDIQEVKRLARLFTDQYQS